MLLNTSRAGPTACTLQHTRSLDGSPFFFLVLHLTLHVLERCAFAYAHLKKKTTTTQNKHLRLHTCFAQWLFASEKGSSLFTFADSHAHKVRGHFVFTAHP